MEGLFFIFIIFGALAALLSKWANSPSLKGQLGEHAVHNTLTKSLDASRYTVLRDVTLNTSRGTTQIDHIVVSQYGIFVIETKNMSGWIFGSEYDAQWTQSFHRRKVRFQNPLRQNHAHIKALEELLGLDSSKFHSMVVFTGSAEFKTQMPTTVMRRGAMLPHIQIRTANLFEHSDIQKIVQTIESTRMKPGADTNAVHLESLRATHSSVTGSVEDARGLMRQGIQSLGLLKLLSSLAVLLVFVLIVGKLFEGVRNIFPDSSVGQSASPAKTLPTNPPNRTPILSATQAYVDKVQKDQTAKKRQMEANEVLAWKNSLMCGYSTDTMRCACYDPKGGKVPIEFEECKVLADKGTGIISR